ncbi:AraC family transcriptional regulator [Vibrio sp. SCSIO 43136]|uniref:AraC family transcriptional regulator n=1 Tax=Vibrio sp. SCSIO 43136 TaxID=2819101 RepID=UPI002075265E|nr:AraC family transcriptional regulator [Vibrio sp. SCSIO 43136]USD66138.1 AraC family transcriptional regulator [Vibrio sp. SCSIO 43136]
MENNVRNISQEYWSSKSIPYLTIRTTRDSAQGYKAHYHSELSVGIMLSGQTCLSLCKEDVLLKEGDVILIEPNMVHACNPVGGMPRSYRMLYIDHQWCCEALSKLFGYQVKAFRVDHTLFTNKVSRVDTGNLISMLIECDLPHIAIKVESLILDILSRCCSPCMDDSDEGLAYQTRELLLNDVENVPQLECIAKYLGYTQETLIRKFKKQFGITPKSFLNNYRVEMAKALLKEGMDITDVANELGFYDQSQLHRTFVSYTASTPRQYQRMKSIFDNNE